MSPLNFSGIDGSEGSTMTVVVIGCVTGVFFVFTVCVVVMLIKSRMRAKRTREFYRFESSEDSTTSKSEPASRKASPVVGKRLSSPNIYGTLDKVVIHSESHNNIPHVNLMREHVQPTNNVIRSHSCSTLQHQNRFVSSMQEQIDRCEDDARLQRSRSLGSQSGAHGSIWFTVHVDIRANQLIVTLIKLRDLKGRSIEDNTRDPFVKVYLLPDDHLCQTSKVVKKSLHPVYNDQFTFDLGDGGISHRSLRFSVYDVDRRRIRHALGHVRVPLQDVDINSSVSICRDLEPDMQSTSSVGEINIGLTYQPSQEKVKVIILRTRNIRCDDVDSELYIILQMHNGQRLIKNKMTQSCRIGYENCFNESFSFSTKYRHVDNINFRVVVMQKSADQLSDDVELGHVNLGAFMFARGSGLLHWQEMMGHARTVVSKWHPLMLQV